jgi:hypothetical protein
MHSPETEENRVIRPVNRVRSLLVAVVPKVPIVPIVSESAIGAAATRDAPKEKS